MTIVFYCANGYCGTLILYEVANALFISEQTKVTYLKKTIIRP